jgi:hypothetical protein
MPAVVGYNHVVGAISVEEVQFGEEAQFVSIPNIGVVLVFWPEKTVSLIACIESVP